MAFLLMWVSGRGPGMTPLQKLSVHCRGRCMPPCSGEGHPLRWGAKSRGCPLGKVSASPTWSPPVKIYPPIKGGSRMQSQNGNPTLLAGRSGLQHQVDTQIYPPSKPRPWLSSGHNPWHVYSKMSIVFSRAHSDRSVHRIAASVYQPG